jgi:TonB family protein
VTQLTLEYDTTERGNLSKAFLLSLTLHAFILLVLSHTRQNEAFPRIIKVSLLEETQNQRKQFVTESQSQPEAPKKATPLLSSKDSFVLKEQVKRGEEALAAVPQRQPQTEKATPQERKVASKNTHSRKTKETTSKSASLTLSPEALEKALKNKSNVNRDNEKKHEDEKQEIKKAPSEYTPFKKSDSNELFRSSPGTLDYLPHIPDGDVTLLNAKANRYAIFVRRVALQVFGALRKKSWQQLSTREIFKIRDNVVVYASMSKEGKLLNVRIGSPSGSESFDQTVLDAANEGTWDQNPPAGAESNDGLIHFIFQAKTWSRRSGEAMQEQRWLLLGTGLK